MFKSFADRMLSTYHFIKVASAYLAQHRSEVTKLRAFTKESLRLKRKYPLQWRLDTTKNDQFSFKGNEVKYRTSDVTGQETYSFDRNTPLQKNMLKF